jgi:hypothetical protein
VVDNFDELTYYLDNEKIVAFNEDGRLYVDYFPIVDHKTEQISVTAGHIEIDLVETSQGRYRLWALSASNGISYKDQDKIFQGSEFTYDDHNSVVIAKGDDEMPALFNGALFDAIEWNLKTDEVKNVKLSGPAFFQTGN